MLSVMRYRLKDLEIDVEARAVWRKGEQLRLPDLSFDVFIKLIKAAPAAVSSEEFSRSVWQATHTSDETIAQRITLLRKALGDSSKNPVYIRTKRGAGYEVAGPVTRIESEATAKTPFFRQPKTLVAAGISFFLVAVAAFMVFGIRSAEVEPSATDRETASISTVEVLITRAREQLGLHQARETRRAIDMLREALELDPENVDARLSLSFALSTKTTKFDGNHEEQLEAEKLARELTEEDPENSNAWSALAYALGSQGRIDESLSAYQVSYQLNPRNTPALSSAAHSYLVRGDLHQALVLELRAKQSGGTSRYAEVQIAQTLELINHPAAQTWYEKALSLNPGQIIILSEVARSHLRRGEPASALQVLAQAEGDDRASPTILKLQARAAIASGDDDAAKLHLAAAGDAGAYVRAALEAVSGNATYAEKLLLPEKLAGLEGNTWPGTRIHFAEVAAAAGRDDEALRFITQAINLGWRDTDWLQQSPFLSALMQTPEGRQIEERIARELENQRRLIEGNDALQPILEG